MKVSVNTGWLRCRTPRAGAHTRLVCFPHAGGSASFFGSWSAHMPAGIEVWAVQYPGREDRITDTPPSGMDALVDEVVAALLPLTDRPLALFGHSMGAAAAYETARALESAHGVIPRKVFASGRHVPGERAGGGIHLLDDVGLVDELVRVGGDGADFLHANPDLWPVFLPAIRGDYRIEETYRHHAGDPLSAPITAVVGDQDPEVSAEQARRWRDYTGGAFTLHVVPGDHFHPARSPEALLELLTRELQ